MGTKYTVDESGKLTLADDIQLATGKKITADFIKSTVFGTTGHVIPALADDTFTLNNAAQTLNNKTLTSPVITNPTLTGTTSDSFFINNDGNGVILDTTGLTAVRTVTFPDSPAQVLVGATATQTLSNKTLTAPVISTIINTGTLTLPTTTTTLVGIDTTDTLSNKTLIKTNTNINGTSSTDFEINSIGNGITLSSTGLTSDRTVTFPDFSSQVLVGDTATQTLTNKTLMTPTIASFINANHDHTNAAGGGTLNISTATTGTLGISRGGTNATTFTASEIVRMNAGGTALESSGKVVPSGAIVGTTDSQTLTNKIITGATNDVTANRLRGATEVEIDSTSTPTNGQALVYNSGTTKAAWSNSGHTIQDEGTPLTQRPKLNFVGSSVTVTDDNINNATIVSVTGGTGSGHTIKDENTALPQRTFLKFTGSEVTASDDLAGDTTVVEIPITNDITTDDNLVTSDINGFEQVVTLEFSGAAPTTPVEDYFVATGGQTVFTLSATPATSTIFFAFINGLARSHSPNNDSSRDYNLTGTTLTFTFGLSVSDIVLVKYLS